jgi:hypothetical protein
MYEMFCTNSMNGSGIDCLFRRGLDKNSILDL